MSIPRSAPGRFFLILIVMFFCLVLAALWFLPGLPLAWSSGHESEAKALQLVQHLQGQAKLVVASRVSSVSLDRADTRYLLKWIYLGTTVVRLRVDNCRTQYVIQGSQVRREDVTYASATHRLSIRLPRPTVDPDLIEIPSDPSCWYVSKSNGWARFNADDLESQARAQLRDKLLESARQKGWDQTLDVVTRDHLTQVFRQVLSDPSLDVEIQWR